MIATFNLIQRGGTFRTILDAILWFQYLQGLEADRVFEFLAGHAFVVEGFAVGADSGETCGAEECWICAWLRI